MGLSLSVTLTGINQLQTELTVINLGEKNVNIEAYVRVENIFGNKSEMFANVNYYSADEERKFYNSRQYRFPPDMVSPDNFIRQAYLFLKTLPEFNGAVDVWDDDSITEGQ